MRGFFVSFFISLFFILYADSHTPKEKKINIGVLSFRPLDENQKQWKHLGDELMEFAPDFEFNIVSLNQKELYEAIKKEQLHLAILHPAAVVEMETKYGVSNIASVIKKTKSGAKIAEYGGVIAALSSREDIKELSHLKNKKIATTHKDAFAAMLLQQDTLLTAGIDVFDDCDISFVGQPMDKVLAALKNGDADVGFFRGGYIEEMIESGKIKSSELKIINDITPKGYPDKVSTPLYPGWAVVATANTKPDTIKHLMVALYQVKSDRSLDYHQFGVPLSYKKSRELMQKHGIYPYDKDRFGVDEIFEKYTSEILFFLVIFGFIAGSLAFRYYLLLAKTTAQSIELDKSKNSLKELNEKLEDRIKEELAKNRDKDLIMMRQSRLAAIGELINNIAHQWRQPLNNVAITIQDTRLAYERGLLDFAYMDKMAGIGMSEINYMSKTIDSLANFFKPEKNKNSFCIEKIIKESLAVVTPTLSHLNIDVILSIEEKMEIFGYENEFGQVIINILNNAKDALEKAQLQNPLISISTKVEDKMFIILIENNGPKIPQEIIGKIFDPYFTTKHSAQGVGLGLYMSKMIIEENMGGFLDVVNTEDGVLFTISFSKT